MCGSGGGVSQRKLMNILGLVLSEIMRMIKNPLSMIFRVYQLPGTQMTCVFLLMFAIFVIRCMYIMFKYLEPFDDPMFS